MDLVNSLLAAAGSFIVTSIATLGYAGVMVLMAFESAGVPLPSEVIMPFSGYLVLSGRFTLLGAALAGAVGCLVGSLAGFWVSAVGGRPLLERYGRYVLFSRHDLAIADRSFTRWGEIIVFVGRLLPIVRTFISFPAGIARMNLWRFSVYTFIGSLIWTYLLAWIGLQLGAQWTAIRPIFEQLEIVVVILLLVGIVWWVRRHLRVRDLA